MGSAGEKFGALGYLTRTEKLFPDENTPDMLIDGMRYADIPFVHIKVHKNNTKMGLYDATTGESIMYTSCTQQGFLNAKKKTSHAAQTTGINFGNKLMNNKYNVIRVKISGFGPGRIEGMKGITMAGVKIISISDVTNIDYSGYYRPKKVRRV